MGLNESGFDGKLLKRFHDEGKLTIQVKNCNEVCLTKDEAEALYVAEQDQAKKLVNLTVSAASVKDWGDALIFLAGELIDANLAEDAALNTVKELYDNPNIDIKPAAREGITKSLMGFITENSINAFMDIMNSIHWDMEDVKGGNYIEVEVVHSRIHDGSSTADLYGPQIVLQNIRLHEIDGVFICDPYNALNHVLNSYY